MLMVFVDNAYGMKKGWEPSILEKDIDGEYFDALMYLVSNHDEVVIKDDGMALIYKLEDK
jgi:hypothetical protein